MNRLDMLEHWIPGGTTQDVTAPPRTDELVAQYKHVVKDRPLWQLAQDVQDRAHMYANIVEQLKEGRAPTQIRGHFLGDLRTVSDELPNPAAERMLNFCLRKLSGYRDCLVTLATRYGGDLLREIGADQLGAGLTVALGLPPSLELQILYNPSGPAVASPPPPGQPG